MGVTTPHPRLVITTREQSVKQQSVSKTHNILLQNEHSFGPRRRITVKHLNGVDEIHYRYVYYGHR